MNPILASELNFDALASWTPTVGEVVCNFGQVGRVIEVRPAPYNDLILRKIGGSGNWVADPAKCQPVR